MVNVIYRTYALSGVFLRVMTVLCMVCAQTLVVWGTQDGVSQGAQDDMGHEHQANEADTLQEITVRGQYVRQGQTSVGHKIDSEALRALGNRSVADALRTLAGVQVKDYGGVGGMKTVDVRSLGANHTAVAYDGVPVGNAQNGVVDLGQFGIDNLESVELYNGQRSAWLQSARDYQGGSTVYLRTRRPEFAPNRRWALRGAVSTGSFDLISAQATAAWKASDNVTLSATAQWLHSSGRYRFRYRRVLPTGATAYDTTATRHNGDVEALRMEVNAQGAHSAGTWEAKVYGYNSERGIPGAIVSNVWFRGERVWDGNAFAQGRYTGHWNRYSLQLLGKGAVYRTRYRNDDNRVLPVNRRYMQEELYLSAAHHYSLPGHWALKGATDWQGNWFDSSAWFAQLVHRTTLYGALGFTGTWPRIRFEASIGGSLTADRTAGKPWTWNGAPSPSVIVWWQPARWPGLSLRGFAKESYRWPTFNDLYYSETPTQALRPEKARQFDIGAVAGTESHSGWLRSWQLTADGYYNRVWDKIVAYPKGVQFRWTMLNLGRVDIAGVDVGADARMQLSSVEVTAHGQYTWQNARDITDRNDSYYGHRIAYVPRHSGTLSGGARWRCLDVNAVWTYVGTRYSSQENNVYNRLQPWYTTDLAAGCRFAWHGLQWRPLLEVNNLFDQAYDVVLNYPMPGRNFRLTLTVGF